MSCLNISYINTIQIGVHHCNYDTTISSYLWVFSSWSSFLFLLPFDFLMEQLYCSELVVVMFHTVYLFPGLVIFIHLSCFNVWLHYVLGYNSSCLRDPGFKSFAHRLAIMAGFLWFYSVLSVAPKIVVWLLSNSLIAIFGTTQDHWQHH
jgi:hypothetical protein